MQILNKAKIRSELISKRRALEKDYIYQKSLLLKDKIAQFAKKEEKIAFYYATNNELDTAIAMKFFAQRGSQTLLPKVIEGKKILEFVPFVFGDKLEKNKNIKNLSEPINNNYTIADVIFVPLVAVDGGNNRVGMGGGYYDATISYYRSCKLNTKFIGLAYDFQLVSGAIETSDYDQKLDNIILV